MNNRHFFSPFDKCAVDIFICLGRYLYLLDMNFVVRIKIFIPSPKDLFISLTNDYLEISSLPDKQ